jgi:hypothetical protein
MVHSASASVLKGTSNSSAVRNTSHITQMLKDKIDWNCEDKNPVLLYPRALQS